VRGAGTHGTLRSMIDGAVELSREQAVAPSLDEPAPNGRSLTANEPILAPARPAVQGRRMGLESIQAHTNAADVNNTTTTAPSDAARIRP
jgi:hypothetical protein